jgi:hypothetical protein
MTLLEEGPHLEQEREDMQQSRNMRENEDSFKDDDNDNRERLVEDWLDQG